MGLTLRERRALARIQEDLGAADPRLASLLDMFGRLAAADGMPRHERIGVPGRAAPGRQLGLMCPAAPARRPGRRGDTRGWQLAGLLLSLAAAIVLITTAVVSRGAAPAGCLAPGTIACAGQLHQRWQPALPPVRAPGGGHPDGERPAIPSMPGARPGGS
ncbi:MAG: hypothetical protein LBI49_03015 [Nocardiopsaceae bacterium]|jgi:hypothetical protein|nr:hypothetical protein [Nocardiopsaceae bacterium]